MKTLNKDMKQVTVHVLMDVHRSVQARTPLGLSTKKFYERIINLGHHVLVKADDGNVEAKDFMADAEDKASDSVG